MSATDFPAHPDGQEPPVADNDLSARIFELEAKAADSDMIASLSTDEETRIYNRGLARKLRDHVARLRKQRDSAKLRPRNEGAPNARPEAE
jgi:hypothetical protein